MKIIYDALKQSLLVIAGSLVGVLATTQQQYLVHSWKLNIALVLLLIFIGSGTLDNLGELVVRAQFKLNKIFKLIAIISPYEIIDGENSSWVNVSLSRVLEIIKRENIKSRSIKRISKIRRYPIILNPYGGSYPEENFQNLSSLSIIFDYVKNGGVFINVADIPFYHAYSDSHHRNIDTTPFAGGFRTDRSFFDTLITQKLGLFVLNSEGLVSSKIKRVFILNSATENLHKRDYNIPGFGKASPVVLVKYGLGCFVFSTIKLKSQNLKHLVGLIKCSQEFRT